VHDNLVKLTSAGLARLAIKCD